VRERACVGVFVREREGGMGGRKREEERGSEREREKQREVKRSASGSSYPRIETTLNANFQLRLEIPCGLPRAPTD